MEEKHDTSRNIIIAVLVIAIIAILGYFVYTSTLDNEEEAIPNEVEDIVDDDETFNEVGSYTGMETFGDDEATGTIELVLANDGTGTLVLAYEDTNEYTGTYRKSGNSITFTADSKEETNTDNSVVDDTIDNITDSDDNGDNVKGETSEDVTSETFNFRIENGTLYYTSKETGEDVVLDKVKRNTLQYIEE